MMKKLIFLFLCLCLAAGAMAAYAEETPAAVQPVFENGMAQPIFTYTDARETSYTNENSDILRFCVYVETDYDTDGDGMADLVEALVQVPRAAAEGSYKAATIYDPTPYGAGTVDETGMDASKLMNPVPFDYEKLYEPASVSGGERRRSLRERRGITGWRLFRSAVKETRRDWVSCPEIRGGQRRIRDVKRNGHTEPRFPGRQEHADS